ncbi:hypothetical protein KHC28_00315 [Ancylobacter sonchi]|uniref:hypothetical protein n=1 Tax=Ancylobacter sonchi TaxID=1937790 RepID=UPI001BD3D912|nr:hypothetical protein [Ancylobacter sonchi]MBS7532108.1 hypothetical protein [Ancylobacter sonchi]
MSIAMTAADVRHALLNLYSGPGWRLFFEVSNDTGTKANRWIDAVACGIWPSNGFEVIGIEIKVSRADWKREREEPEKAQALMRFCNRWYLACPDGLVKPDELPVSWGLLTVKDGKARTKVQAPKLEPEPLTSGFVMAILRHANALDMELVQRLVEERDAARQKSFDEALERTAARRVADVSQRADKALKVAERIKAITGDDIADWSFDDKALAAAYLLMKQGRVHETIGYGVETLPGLLVDLRRAQTALEGWMNLPALVDLRQEIAAADPDLKSRKGR